MAINGNGNGKNVTYKWIVGFLAALAIGGLGWQLKSAMPRTEVDVLKKQADETHARLEKVNDAQTAAITAMQVQFYQMAGDLAVIKSKVQETYDKQTGGRR